MFNGRPAAVVGSSSNTRGQRRPSEGSRAASLWSNAPAQHHPRSLPPASDLCFFRCPMCLRICFPLHFRGASKIHVLDSPPRFTSLSPPSAKKASLFYFWRARRDLIKDSSGIEAQACSPLHYPLQGVTMNRSMIPVFKEKAGLCQF